MLCHYCPTVLKKKLNKTLKILELLSKMAVIDLKFQEYSGYPSISNWKGVAYEFRKNSLCSIDEIPANLRVSPRRPTLSGNVQSANLFLFGSILMHGLCPVGLSRKFARHRSVSSCQTGKTLSYGNPQQNFTKYLSLYQRKSRLADLCRLSPSSHSNGAPVICQRRLWSGTGTNRVRSRFHHHQFVPFSISLGQISQPQRSRETAHPAGFAGQHSHRGHHYPRENPRCQYPRPTEDRSGAHLYHASGLSGFWPPLYDPSVFGFFYHTSQKQLRFPTSLFPTCRQINRGPIRSNHYSPGLLRQNRLSRKTAPCSLLRSAEQQTFSVLNQQLYSPSPYDCRTLSLSLADRVVFQMDQDAS